MDLGSAGYRMRRFRPGGTSLVSLGVSDSQPFELDKMAGLELVALLLRVRTAVEGNGGSVPFAGCGLRVPVFSCACIELKGQICDLVVASLLGRARRISAPAAAFAGHATTTQRAWQLSTLQIAMTLPWLMTQYWWKLFVPAPLNAYHVFVPVGSLGDVRPIVGLLFLGGLLAILIYTWRRFPATWNVFAERYLYLPSVGFCLLVRIGRSSGFAPRARATTSTCRFHRIGHRGFTVWRDDICPECRLEGPSYLVWEHAGEIAQRTVCAGDGCSTANRRRRCLAGSRAALSKGRYRRRSRSSSDRVNMGIAYKGLAAIYSARGEYDRGLEMLSRAREAAPDDREIDGEQGLILSQAGRWDEAAIYLQKAAAHSADDANVLNALGIHEQQRNRQLDKAIAYFQRALSAHAAADSFAASVHNNLGSVYGELARYADAIEQFRAAIAIAPGDPEYHVNLATALAD